MSLHAYKYFEENLFPHAFGISAILSAIAKYGPAAASVAGAASAGKGKTETTVIQELGPLSPAGQSVLNAYNQIYSVYPIPELANQYMNQVNFAMSQFADLAPRIIESVGDVKVSIGGKGVSVKPLGAIRTLISAYLEPLKQYMAGANSVFQNMMQPGRDVLAGEYGARGSTQTQTSQPETTWGERIQGATAGLQFGDIIAERAKGYLKQPGTEDPTYKKEMLASGGYLA